MTILTFDTLKFANRLKAVGIPDKQAEAFVEAQQGILSEALDTTLATHDDMITMDRRIDGLDSKVDKLAWMVGILIAMNSAILIKLFLG